MGARHASMLTRKTSLTFEEEITAGYLYYVQGLDQFMIAIALGVTNVGRISEACTTIERALRPDAEPVQLVAPGEAVPLSRGQRNGA